MSTQFTAFISYSHRDSWWAKWVQRAIENYRLPKALALEMGRSRKLGKVFRDREELSTGQNLGDHLTAALDSSDNLIVICSPNSKASPWVAKEIEYFKALGRGDRIFCLLVEGGAESLADPLLTDVDGNPLEPLAADPRDEGDGKRLAKLKLISGILDTNLDQLAQRERARRQRLFLGYAGLANIFLIAVGAALYFEQERKNEAAQKALERELGIQNVASMTEFVERTRQYYDKGALSFVSERFTGYLDRFDDNDLDASQKVTKAKALRVVGEANYDLGDTGKSIAALESSVELFELASAEEPANLDLAIETAFADFYLGATHLYAKNYEAALTPLERYRDRILALYQQYPDNPLLIEESVNAPTSVLRLHTDSSSVVTPEIRASVLEVSKAIDRLQGSTIEENASLQHVLHSAMHQSAHAFMKSCEVFSALPYRKRAVEYARRAVELDPRNRDYQTNLANTLYALADINLTLGKGLTATLLYLEAFEHQEYLYVSDPNNQYLLQALLNSKLLLLRTANLNPDATKKFPNLMTTIDIPALTSEINALENPVTSAHLYLQLALHSLQRNENEQVVTYLGQLKDVTRKINSEKNGRFIALADLLSKLTSEKTQAVASHAVLTFPISQEGNNSCLEREQRWATLMLAGDYEGARLHKLESQRKGLIGLESSLLGNYAEGLTKSE